MAKLGSSSCRPLLQGMMLLALLLLASIQAGPVMALLEQAGEAIINTGKEVLPEVRDHVDVAEKLRNQGAKTILTRYCKPGWERFCKGGKTGLRVHRYLCKAAKAQGWMDKQNPGGASGTPYFAVDILGGDLLSKSFPSSSYSVTSNSVVPCWSADQPQVQAAATTLFPSSYPPTMSVRITGIRVLGQGQEDLLVQTTPAYLYGPRLREAVIEQMKALKPVAKPFNTADSDKLCYLTEKWSLPRISILLGSDNGGVMQTMELSGGATGTVWYQESFMFCLGIRTTVELILGTP